MRSSSIRSRRRTRYRDRFISFPPRRFRQFFPFLSLLCLACLVSDVQTILCEYSFAVVWFSTFDKRCYGLTFWTVNR